MASRVRRLADTGMEIGKAGPTRRDQTEQRPDWTRRGAAGQAPVELRSDAFSSRWRGSGRGRADAGDHLAHSGAVRIVPGSFAMMDETEAAELAHRARRPNGAAQACKNCCYWDIRSFEIKQLETERAANEVFSDLMAECRRHAPYPMERHIGHMTSLLGLIAWSVEKTANVKHESDNIYSADTIAENEVNEWPMTNANDWCGDFLKRDNLSNQREINPC